MLNMPLTAAGSRELKRPRAVPPKVRAAIQLMVRGRDDDPDCVPLSFIEAAKVVGLTPPHMRRYLDRPNVLTLLHRERRAYRAALCAGNEGALLRIRDKSPNAMAQIGAIKTLEALEDEGRGPGANSATGPGITIQILSAPAAPVTIAEGRTYRPTWADSQPPAETEPEPEPPPPIFKPWPR